MMRIQVPVEPLDDKRYARIEDQILVSFRPGALAGATTDGAGHSLEPSWTRTLRWFGRGVYRLAPAVAVAGILAAIYFYQGTTDLAPARIATSADGSSTIDLGDAVCTIAPDTRIDLAGAQKSGSRESIAFDLARGQIDCEVEPRAERAAVVVRAGEVEVTVVGTVFGVRRDELVHVTVSRGKVRVDAAGSSHYVAAGESWSGPALVADAGKNDELLADLASQSAEAASGPGADTSGELSGSAEQPGGESSTGTIAGSGQVDTSTDAPGTELLGSRTARRPQPSGRPGDRRSGKSQPKTGKKQRRRVLARAKPSRGNPPSGARGELADIMALESSDPEEAIARYRKIAFGRGPAAEFALYSAAYVQYFELRDRRAALQSLQHYQRRFARGAHRESAMWLRVRILCEGDDRKACRAAAHSYLNRFPDGRHAKIAQQIINWDM